MKKTLVTLFLLLVGPLSIAMADSGPYMIRDTGYCTEYELYLTHDDFIYGREIGCSYQDDRSPTQFIGILSPERHSFFLIDSNPKLTNWDFPDGSMLIVEYNFMTMWAEAYITDGRYFDFYGEWEWRISLH